MFELFAFALINLFGAMSPGPDFAIVMRYGLTGSRRAAFLATAGIATALLVHVCYCVLGIIFIIQSSKILFSILHVGGALYLGYLGLSLIRAKEAKQTQADPHIHKRAFRDGFFTNLLNPKATLFLFSLFAEFITPDTSWLQKLSFGLTVPLTATAWFLFLSFMVTHRKFLPVLQRYQKFFMVAMGTLLLLLSIWILIAAF